MTGARQLSLLDPDPRAPYRRRSASSRDGAKRADARSVSQTQRARGLYVDAGPVVERPGEGPRGGLTDEELALAMGVKVTTAIPRRHELIAAGLVYPKPVARRPAVSGVRVGIWVAIEHQPRSAA